MRRNKNKTNFIRLKSAHTPWPCPPLSVAMDASSSRERCTAEGSRCCWGELCMQAEKGGGGVPFSLLLAPASALLGVKRAGRPWLPSPPPLPVDRVCVGVESEAVRDFLDSKQPRLLGRGRKLMCVHRTPFCSLPWWRHRPNRHDIECMKAWNKKIEPLGIISSTSRSRDSRFETALCFGGCVVAFRRPRGAHKSC